MAPVPTGATTGNVVVTVGGVASNGVTFTVGNAPEAYVQGNSVDSQTSQTTFTLTTVSSGTAKTSNAHDLLVGADTTDAVTNGAGAAYTTRILTNDILEDEEVKTTGSYSATASIGTNAPPNGQVIHYVIQMIAFRAAH